MTTLLPFDLETALREPERVRHINGSGRKALAVAHFPSPDEAYRVAVLWEGDRQPSFYAEDGGYFNGSVSRLLFLAPKTRKVWVRIMGCGDGEFDTHISLHPACQEALPVGWRWLDSGPTEIEIRDE